MHHRTRNTAVLAAGLLMTSIMHSPVGTDRGDGTREHVGDTIEAAATAADRDVLMINGTAFDLS